MKFQPITPLQLEAIQMCHNSMVGHGGVDRTILKLLSLEEQWIDMSKHVKRMCGFYPHMRLLSEDECH